LVPGPLDQHRLLQRADVLHYLSVPLDDGVDIAGQVGFRAFFESSAVDTDLIVKLLDVQADGRVRPIAEGALRGRFREGLDHEKLLTPGEVAEFNVDLGHTAHRFRPGHRIGLLVTSSNFPHLDRNLNTGESLATGTTCATAVNRVHFGVGRPSALILEVLT